MEKIKKLVQDILQSRANVNRSGSDTSEATLYYQGFDPRFHKYSVFNGEKRVPKVKKSMGMGKKVAEDWASMIFSEKLDIVTNDKEKLTPLLIDMGFWSFGAKATEMAFAVGLSALVVDLRGLDVDPETGELVKTEKSRIGLTYYSAGDIMPLSWEDGEVIECAFCATNGSETKTAIHILHENTIAKDEEDPNPELAGTYDIIFAKSDSKNKEAVEYTILHTQSETPFFSVFSPNIANNRNSYNKRPIGVILNAIPILQSIDNKYDGLDNEISLGKKRLYISSKMNKVTYEKDENGDFKTKIDRSFDENDVMIYALPENDAPDGKPFIYSPNDPLRVDQYIAGINFDLQILSELVGLGSDFYKFDKGRVMTATQVISEGSKAFRNLKKHEQLFEVRIRKLIKAICVANNEFTGNEALSTDDCQVVFDDSVIEDRDAEMKRDQADVTAGIMSKSQYRAKWYGEAEKDAKEAVDAIYGDEEIVSRFTALNPIISSNVLTTKMAVHLIFKGKEDVLKEAGYDSIEAYIAEVEENAQKAAIDASELLGMGNRANDGGEGR